MNLIRNSIAAASLFAALVNAQAPKPRYEVIDVGTLGGGYTYGYGLNNGGAVIGGAATPAQTDGFAQTAFVWRKGQIHSLGTLGGAACSGCSSEGAGISGGNVIAVISETDNIDPNGQDFCGFQTHRQCLGAVWNKGDLKPLPPLPGGYNSQAYSINNQNEIAGFSETGVDDLTCAAPFQVKRFVGVIWDAQRKPRPLRPLPGDNVSFAFGINERGQAVGVSGLCSNTTLPPNGPPGGPHAVLWEEDGTPRLIDTSSLGAPVDGNNVATSINDRGELVGTTLLLDGTVHSFVWNHGHIRDLGTLPGDFATIAGCCGTVNNSGEVVGFAFPGPFGSGHAIAWLDNNGPVDLNDLIPANSGYYLVNSGGINDAGEIVAGAFKDGQIRSVLLRPMGRPVPHVSAPAPAGPGVAVKLPKYPGNRGR
jgi:probable HAF family extracellular repeat protein